LTSLAINTIKVITPASTLSSPVSLAFIFFKEF
jgi:hypothetical protein